MTVIAAAAQVRLICEYVLGDEVIFVEMFMDDNGMRKTVSAKQHTSDFYVIFVGIFMDDNEMKKTVSARQHKSDFLCYFC